MIQNLFDKICHLGGEDEFGTGSAALSFARLSL